MNTAAQLCLRLLSSLFTLAWAAVPLCQASPCSSFVAGVLYGSFSLRDLFPGPHGLRIGCSWTVENPDPTKYTLYFRFNRHAGFCLAFSPLVLPLDHYLANQTCGQVVPESESVDPCQVPGPHAFLQFDKNFVQLCLVEETKQFDTDEKKGTLTAETLDFRLVEVLLINNENSSQFTCGVLCRWFEECLRSGSGRESEGCGITQTGCVCPNAGPPVPILPATPHNHSLDPSASVLLPPTDDCCVTQLHGKNGISNIAPRDVHQDFDDDEQKVKTQRPRSADQPGVFQAQTGDPAAEEWSQWSVCSLTCGQGWQVRTRSCVSSPYGTLCSGPLRETRLCNNTATCPVEGLWLDWAPWSGCSVSCGTGSQQRQRHCSVSVHSEAECKGLHSETRECTNRLCDGAGSWGAWNQWSLCSKTCDSGWQRRVRMCEGTGIQNYPCDGSGEEVRSCNDKKCPAPHEVCKDEYQGLIMWKRTSAGETVYNKCPSNATGSASRRCLLDVNGVAYWGPPSFARCISLEYRYLHLSLREHLAKGQRTLAGEGMSQIVRSLLELMSRHSYYSGDLLFSVEILRNIVSLMLDMDNLQKWEDAHQVSPGAMLLMRVVDDFIHLIGEAQKPFQSFLAVTTNLIINIQREPVSAVSSDINFPMKGRRGMKDWARSAEDKLFIPKEVFSLSSDESDEATYFVIGAILYRTLGFILPPPKDPLVISSKILSVTVRPHPKPTEPVVVVELAPLLNGTSQPQCVVWDHTSTEAGEENWDVEGCKTLPSPTVHTKCLCSKISTFAVLAQKAKEPGLCTVTAAFLHFFFLASFCWVLTEAWQSYLAVIGKIRSRLIRKRFLCLGWGLPALVVAVSVGFTRARGYGTQNYSSLEAHSRLLLQCSKCGVISSTALSSSTTSSAMTSLWSSCVVLPLLALTWMSAVLAITDRRSTVQDAVRCRMGGCKDDSENSPDSCKNGQTDFEKDVDLACQTVIFKEVNTCNPASITGTLSRISLDDEDDPKLVTNQEGINFSSLPGNIPQPNLLAQVPTLGTLNELNETPRKKEVNLEQQGQHQRSAPVYLCTESALGWARSSTAATDPASSVGGSEGDYMVLPRRTVSLKPNQIKKEKKPLNISVEDPPFPPPPSPMTLHPAESEPYPADFASVDHVGVGLNRSYGTGKQVPGLASAHALKIKQSRPSIRQIFTSGKAERTRTLPRNLGSANANVTAGSLERKRVRYSELDFEKVMHTRKRHSELYHELNHSTKFHTIDRYNRDPAMAMFKDKATNDEQHSWNSFKTMTTEPSSGSGGQNTDRVELQSKAWDASAANTPDTSEGDFQTEV
ncbi:Adhesion G protein-coupled receptor B2 [Bagarius yarrelli]|uniref:Adhesion G protein-coupled receptor B2 n=1 Tax=Bagarius yarrelli TaxID=175774 RepID=A0A556TNU1_BAGYA|nr:Adhesion G protein-coupled receptor B2 [Bagarius yarrelli]